MNRLSKKCSMIVDENEEYIPTSSAGAVMSSPVSDDNVAHLLDCTNLQRRVTRQHAQKRTAHDGAGENYAQPVIKCVASFLLSAKQYLTICNEHLDLCWPAFLLVNTSA